MSRTCTYKVIKGAWGIRIALTARAERRDPPAGSTGPCQPALEIVDRVNLSAVEKQHLVRGFNFAADEVMTACGPQAVTVVVESVSFAESDYRPEGLAVAMLRWLEEEFSLPGHQIQAAFDRHANQYQFDWVRHGS